METTLTPTIGSNQWKTKFVPNVKKRSFKIKFATKVKIGIIGLLFASLYLNYVILRANYVVRCSAGGMFMSQSKCDELSQNKNAASEVDRQQVLINNPDLFN